MLNYSITDDEFNTISELSEKLTGIKLTESKKALIIARLSATLRKLDLNSFSEYINFLQTDGTQEDIKFFINRITTNETSFFREKHHFDFLKSKILHELLEQKISSGNLNLRVWSAACSTGEEPYSLAITILEYFKGKIGYDIKILASDLSTSVLDVASKGEYNIEDLKNSVPHDLIHKYFHKVNHEVYRINDEVKRLISFRQINFLDERYPLKSKVDIVFCRNALIYFDDTIRDMIVTRFYNHLNVPGFLFVGHSENLFRHSQKFKLISNTTYSKIHSSGDM